MTDRTTLSLFAVTRRPGPGWHAERPLAEQADFRPHADYMHNLYAQGAVVFGGFLDGGPEVLLIMRGSSAGEVRAALAGDPWMADILPIDSVAEWTLGLGQIAES